MYRCMGYRNFVSVLQLGTKVEPYRLLLLTRKGT